MTKTKNNTNKATIGFTLVELLVVMMIIALLAGISSFGLQGAREAGRDARRKADLETIRSALELYKSDCDSYPVVGNFPDPGDPLVGDGTNCPSANTYVSEMPGDPQSGDAYCYNPDAALTSYELCADLEEDPATTDSCNTCDNGPVGVGDYRVASP